MKKIICYFDESGAKGYADNKESSFGESGTVAGFAIWKQDIDLCKSELDKLLAPYLCGGKLHITDLCPVQQSTLRRDVFDWLKKKRFPCFYDAKYVQGFNEGCGLVSKLVESGRKASSSRYKSSSNRPQPRSLHEELFQGLAQKTYQWCKSQYGNDFCIDYVTDRVDNAVLKKLRNAVKEILDLNAVHAEPAKVWDSRTNTVIDRTVISCADLPKRMRIDKDQLGGVTMANQDSPFVVVADVIANSMNHHFQKLQDKSVGLDLDSKIAVEGHPLSNLFKLIDDNDSQGIRSVYGYPHNQEKNDKEDMPTE